MLRELSLCGSLKDSLSGLLQSEAAKRTWRSRLGFGRASRLGLGGFSTAKNLVLVTNWQGS